ncbi:MAG: GNAT family N-acetyltransferase [Humibacillus sp.]|nr:GNAT family N-acetyltransferase [Humibacillus sp.]MDN5777375.1 GNAT family N-acetyltransferase [Humibacillus sp.]
MTTELVELRTYYSAPGLLLLARDDGQPAGCVGVRALVAPIGEVRRLFVRPEYRGQGFGRRLLEAATEQARRNGLCRLVLTTLPTMTEARMLYEHKATGRQSRTWPSRSTESSTWLGTSDPSPERTGLMPARPQPVVRASGIRTGTDAGPPPAADLSEPPEQAFTPPNRAGVAGA